MKRREFIATSMGAVAATNMVATNVSAASPAKSSRGTFAVDGNRVKFYLPKVKAPIRVMVVADTHLFTDDERGEPYREFSGRMAGAYNQTRHFQTGEVTNPEESFERVLERAKENEVNLLALVGDIFSFPSEAAIDWVGQKLEDSGLRYAYVAGNHDWHYEGMAGSLEELRATWIEKRLKPLYQQSDPLMSFHDVGEIRFLTIDDSHCQILPRQLEFFRAQVATGKPLVLMLHIPLFAPGRPMGYGCGNPDWGAKSDRNFELERRPRWPESGHTQATLDFHREVFSAPNLLGVFAGHIHRSSLDVVNGIPQFVTDDNASGAWIDAEFLPASASGS